MGRVAVPSALVSLALKPCSDDGSPLFAVDTAPLRACLEELATLISQHGDSLDRDTERLDRVEQQVSQQKSMASTLRADLEAMEATHHVDADPGSSCEGGSRKNSTVEEEALLRAEQEAAALMIQTRFRGRQSRKEAESKRKAKAAEEAKAAKAKAKASMGAGVDKDAVRRIVQNEIHERFADIDVLDMDVRLRRSSSLLDRLQAASEQQKADWNQIQQALRVATEERLAIRRQIGSVDIIATSSSVKGLLMQQAEDELEQERTKMKLKDHDERIQALEAENNELKRQLGHVDIPKLQDALQEALSSLKHLTERVTVLEEEVKTQRQQNDALRQTVDSLLARADGLEQKLAETRSVVDEALKMFKRNESAMKDMQDRLQQGLLQLEAARSDLEERLASVAAELRGQLLGEISALRAWLEEVFRDHEARVREKAERSEVEFANEALLRLHRGLISEGEARTQLEQHTNSDVSMLRSQLAKILALLEPHKMDSTHTALLGTKPLRRCLSCHQTVGNITELDTVNLIEEQAKDRLYAEVKTALHTHTFLTELKGVTLQMPKARTLVEAPSLSSIQRSDSSCLSDTAPNSRQQVPVSTFDMQSVGRIRPSSAPRALQRRQENAPVRVGSREYGLPPPNKR